jgi:transposase
LKDVVVPKPYPREFRDDVVRVARDREPGVTIEQISKDFGVHPMTLQKWLQRAAVEDRTRPGQSRTESAESPEARKRIRLLEKEAEVLRRAAAYLSQANLPGKVLPAREGARRGQDPCRGDVPGIEALSSALSPVAGGPCHAE